MPAEFTSKLHDQLSLNVLVRLSRLQRLLRGSRRPAMRAFRDGLAFRRVTSDWSDDRKRDWVLQRLRAVVRTAHQTTPYYSALLRDVGFDPAADFEFADFAHLPVLDREQIQLHGSEMIASKVSRDQLRLHASGGSTGVPTEVWQGPEEIGWGESGTEHFMRTIGVPEGSRTAYFWGHHLDPQATDSLRDRIHAFETNTRWFDCLRLDDEKLESYHQAFASWRPKCIIAYASAVGSLAEYLHRKGYQPNYPRQCFVTGAEKLWPRHRELIAEVFGRPVHERYGARDAGGIGFQLRPTASLDYHLDWANVLVEPASSDFEAEILITKLHADGMPMLRYRVGDMGRFPVAATPGEPNFVLHEVLGRATDRIWARDGHWISGLQIPHLLKDYPIRQFLFLQKADYSVDLQIVPQKEYSGGSSSSIQSLLQKNLPGIEVEIRLVDAVPTTKANKWRPVVSEVGVADAQRQKYE